MGVKRGELVLVSVSGDYGKPRPALIIQSDRFSETGSLTVLLITTFTRDDLVLTRIAIEPTSENGLRKPSAIMADKIMTLPRDKVQQVIGRLAPAKMTEVNLALSLFLGLTPSAA